MANCEPVQKAMHGFCPDIRLVPNGCDSDPPRASPASGTQFDAFQSYAGKTIGYAGNLETKIDIALLSRVDERFPHCRVVLVRTSGEMGKCVLVRVSWGVGRYNKKK